jgi:hypothetical protein
MSLQLLENKALSRGIIGKLAPILAEITIRKSQEVSTGGNGREAEAEKLIPGRRIIGTGCETRFCVFSQEDSPLRHTTSLYIPALAASTWDFCLTTDDLPFLMPCGRYGVVPRHDLPAL